MPLQRLFSQLSNVWNLSLSLFLKIMIPIKPENVVKINFNPSAFFLKPFYLLISLISRTRLQNLKLQERDVKKFWVSFVNIVSTFFPYFILIQAQEWIAHKHLALEVVMDKHGIYMQHLVHLAEDKSYLQKDCNKFKHWYQKWTCSRIPILVSLSIKVLTP